MTYWYSVAQFMRLCTYTIERPAPPNTTVGPNGQATVDAFSGHCVMC